MALTVEDRFEIKRLRKKDPRYFTTVRLGKQFGVGKARISQICNRPLVDPDKARQTEKFRQAASEEEIYNDYCRVWADALAKSHLEPVIVKLRSGKELTDNELFLLRNGGLVYFRMIAQLDKSNQLKIDITNIQNQLNDNRDQSNVTVVGLDLMVKTVLGIVKEKVPEDTYREIVSDIQDMAKEHIKETNN